MMRAVLSLLNIKLKASTAVSVNVNAVQRIRWITSSCSNSHPPNHQRKDKKFRLIFMVVMFTATDIAFIYCVWKYFKAPSDLPANHNNKSDN